MMSLIKKIIYLFVSFACSTGVSASTIVSGGFDEPVFDAFQGVVVSSHTPSNDPKLVPIENLFNGKSTGNDNQSAAIFSNVGVGNVAYVEFHTDSMVQLNTLKLALRENKGGAFPGGRSVSQWTLYGNDTGIIFDSEDVISTGVIDSNYELAYGSDAIVITDEGMSGKAQFFRLELTQADNKGIRVMELGMGGHPVPKSEGSLSHSQAKLNVLMIVIDDLRPEIGCYGGEAIHSPNIDRFARKGMQFNHAYSQYPVCGPSRSSFLSGLRPDEVGITSNTVPLRRAIPEIVTLPQLFRENGYFTAGIGKIFHLSVDRGDERVLYEDPLSWDYFFDTQKYTTELGKQGEGRNLTDGKIPWASWKAAEGEDIDQPDGMNNAKLLEVLEANRDRPFFIGYGIHKPHDPFIAPKKYFELYPEGSTQLVDEPKDRSERVEVALPSNSLFDDFTDKERREFKRAYHACVSFADAQVGKVLDELDRLELWDDTVVILMGDHGYHLGEHDWWNKVTVFEDGSRAPMIIWAPGAAGMGQVTDSIVELVDIYPTLADYGGLEAPHELSGSSMRPILEVPEMVIKPAAYSQVNGGKGAVGRSVRTPRWRYTEWDYGDRGVELYDHSQDSGEYYNLSQHPEYSNVVKAMQSLLHNEFPRGD